MSRHLGYNGPCSQDAAYKRVRKNFPPAKNFPCKDCSGAAVEYDHPLGYGENWDVIEPVCRSCHMKREKARGRNFRPKIGPYLESGRFLSEEASRFRKEHL